MITALKTIINIRNKPKISMVKCVVKGEKMACSTLKAGKDKPFAFV